MSKDIAYKASVNGQFDFTGLQGADLDAIALGHGHFHILQDGQAYAAEVLHADHASKIFSIRINGNTYQVQLADQYDQLVNRLGLGRVAKQQLKDLKAPMPGLVLDIMAAPGQVVQKGDPLFILEAMKMENVIKSPGEGTVSQVLVSKGMPVDKGQPLLLF